MIRKIYSSDDRFKKIRFENGLNIILADRTLESGIKDTRNGAGKTTLINIIHFCLGADLSKLSLPVKDIQDWDFYIEIDLNRKLIIAKRSIQNPNIIEIKGNVSRLPIQPKRENSGKLLYKNDDWKTLLGICLFNFRKELRVKYNPSFRSLISYFVRRRSDAYLDPFSFFRSQKGYSIQINNSYLLGMNWVHASELQEIKEKENAIKALALSIRTGISETLGELEAKRIQLQREIAVENEAISNFKVLPQYEELQKKANNLTVTIHEISNRLLFLRHKLVRYEESVASEHAPDSGAIEKLYTEAGLLFPDTIRKTLNEAKLFHKSIVSNRKKFLNAEIVQIKNQISVSENEMRKLAEERAGLMLLLRDHGALDEFSHLQERLLGKNEQLNSITSKISSMKNISQMKQEIKKSKNELDTIFQRDYEESRPNWEKAVAIFGENTKALYDEPGNLVIDPTDNGYEFNIEIPRSSSEGVSKMKIFCYDLMLVEMLDDRKGIDFLIHDSTIFDGVDSRQRAIALKHALNKSEYHNFQYICAFNSDQIPTEDLGEDFNIDQYVRLRLTDRNPSESVLGFHFEIKKNKKQ